MNANFGLFPPMGEKIRNKKLKYEMLANRALDRIATFSQELHNI
jgi:methylenetetrahydrofolate--tRNA-(uracil-5-)-methyltransferase